MSKNYLLGNNRFMNKKEYVEKLKNVILNRVKFHAPIVYDSHIDRECLSARGVNLDKPIFKFDKVLNKSLLKAFKLALEEEDFNLLLSTESLGKLKEKDLKLKNVVLYGKNNSALFLEMINKLNINYSSASNYNLVFKEKFFKVGGQILNPHFEDFLLKQVLVKDNVFVDYCEFVLNGSNFYVKLQNKDKKPRRIELELNIPLKKGYYYFKKMSKSLQVENLLSKEKLYLNFVCKNAKFSFSNVDGLENSVFCCINVKVSLNLKGGEEGFVFFNLGEGKFCPSSDGEIEKLKRFSFVKVCEIFNVQVKTKNPNFDWFFNKRLPQRIWINWLNGEVDAAVEQKYISLKRLFVRGVEQFSLVNFKEIGLREIGIFNGEYYKKILVITGSEKFLRVGRAFFYNIHGITNHSLKSKEPISVCFGAVD